MEKPAKNDYPILDVIKRRWSPRAFGDKLIEPTKVRQLFEAARWSASSYNEQPWRFIVASRDNEAEFSKALACLVEQNQAWAKRAPLLILAFAKKTFSKNKKPNRVHVHDLGAAMANLSLQATAMGMFVHQMAGVDLDKMASTYKVPDDFEPVTAAAVGYGGDPATLPEDFRESELAERSRRPLEDVVFAGKWNSPAPLVKA